MKPEQFLSLMAKLLEMAPGTLNGPEKLRDIEAWDSLAIMGFISLVDQQFSMIISPQKIAECKTINDLMSLLGDRIDH